MAVAEARQEEIATRPYPSLFFSSLFISWHLCFLLHANNYNYVSYIVEYRMNGLFFEEFKVGGKGTTKQQQQDNAPDNSGSGTATGAIAGAATGALVSGGSAAVMSNSGSNNVEKCPLDNDTLYCQISRTAGITGMLVYILFIIILVLIFFYSMYYLFFRTGSGSNGSKAVSQRRR